VASGCILLLESVRDANALPVASQREIRNASRGVSGAATRTSTMKLTGTGWLDELDEKKLKLSAASADDEFGDGYESESPFDDDEEEEEVSIAVNSDDDDLGRVDDDVDDLLEPEPRVEEAIIVAAMPSPVRGYDPAERMSGTAKPARMGSANKKPPAKKAVKKAAKKAPAKKTAKKKAAKKAASKSSRKAVKKAAKKTSKSAAKKQGSRRGGKAASKKAAVKKGAKKSTTRGNTLATKKAAKKATKKAAKKSTKKAAKKKK
jgi:hypothetical protein